MYKTFFVLIILAVVCLFGNIVTDRPHILFDIEPPPDKYLITVDDIEKIESKSLLDLPDPGLSEKEWKIVGWGMLGGFLVFYVLIVWQIWRAYKHSRIHINENSTIERGSAQYIASHVAAGNIHIVSLKCYIDKRRRKKNEYPQRISVKCIVKVRVGSSTTEINDFIQDHVRFALEDTAGLSVDEIKVNIKYAKEKKK